MTGIRLNKKDAEILQTILNTIIQKGYASSDNLPSLTNNFLSDLPESKRVDYKYYVDLINIFNVVKIEKTIGDGFVINPIPLITKRFYVDGGFEGLFEQQQQEQIMKDEYEKIRLNKLKWDSKLSKWQAKTFWYVFVLGIVGGICGILSLTLQISDKKTNEINNNLTKEPIINQIDTTDTSR